GGEAGDVAGHGADRQGGGGVGAGVRVHLLRSGGGVLFPDRVPAAAADPACAAAGGAPAVDSGQRARRRDGQGGAHADRGRDRGPVPGPPVGGRRPHSLLGLPRHPGPRPLRAPPRLRARVPHALHRPLAHHKRNLPDVSHAGCHRRCAARGRV
ncbi:hypothetical protein IWQ57_005457, partial [Coemansia nantahalensis]